MDKKEEEQLLRWYEEIPTDTEQPLDSDDDLSDALSEHSLHNTSSEQSDEESNTDEVFATAVAQPPTRREPIFTGKNLTEWLKHKPEKPRRKTRPHNLLTKLPGVKAVAKGAATTLDCWQLFFSDEIIDKIVISTNQKIEQMRQGYSRSRDCPPTDAEEIRAFLGLLYMAGVKKGQHLNTSELWSTDGTAPEYFAAVMSERRFHVLIRALRFDDKNNRRERAKIDNLAPIREIFDNFVNACSSNFSIGEYVTIDEMLDAFRGKCRFRQYIANKPAKYGIKIYSLADARTFYTHNMEIYAGKQPEGPYLLANDASSVVKRLVSTIDKSGRNVTMDNYFSSIPLANDLLRNHKLTMVGTLRKNKREIPPEFLHVKNRSLCSSMFGYGKDGNDCVLVSYVPKKNKNVLMLSTLHDDDAIDPSTKEAKKPEVITFYNSTKGGVDVVDRLKSEYSVARVSNRWPLTVFFSLLDIATINAQIIQKCNSGQLKTRRKFIAELSKELTLPQLIRRSSIPNLSIPLRQK